MVGTNGKRVYGNGKQMKLVQTHSGVLGAVLKLAIKLDTLEGCCWWAADRGESKTELAVAVETPADPLPTASLDKLPRLELL